MTPLKQALIKEIEEAPDEMLEKFLQLWRQIQVLTPDPNDLRTPGLLKEKLGDQFFEPLPEAELAQWKTVVLKP